MADEPEVIRMQMEQTRSALQEKLETLEKQVTDTVQGAADAATETVQTVKEAVQETVANVKDTVEGTVDSVKETLDLSQHVRDYPWTMFMGAAAVGFVATRLLQPSQASSPPPAISLPVAPISSPPPPAAAPRNGRHGTAESDKNPRNGANAAADKGMLGTLGKVYGEEMTKLQGLAVGTLGAVVRELLTSSAPPALVEQLTDIVDGITEKLGGKPVKGALFQSSTCAGTKAETSDTCPTTSGPDPLATAKARGGIGLA